MVLWRKFNGTFTNRSPLTATTKSLKTLNANLKSSSFAQVLILLPTSCGQYFILPSFQLITPVLRLMYLNPAKKNQREFQSQYRHPLVVSIILALAAETIN